jgi:subtilase family serine protease
MSKGDKLRAVPVAIILLCCCMIGLAACGSAHSPPKDAAASSTRVLVALPLSVRASELAALADRVAEFRSGQFGRFVSLAQIARSYGASSSAISADEAVLAKDGIHLNVDATHGALWGAVTAAQVKTYFGTWLVDSSGTLQPAGTPHVPPGLHDVTGVVGLDGSTEIAPIAVPNGSSNPPCPPVFPTRASLARLYGFTQMVADGATGSGTTIDIVAVHRFLPAVFATYNRCAGSHLNGNTVSQQTVPNTPTTSGGNEVSLDSLILTLLAPAAHLHIVNFDPSTSLAFPLMSLMSFGATPNILDITVTYCESEIPAPQVELSEWLLSALAATGTTTAAAAGDTGSSGCYPDTVDPAVTYPASSDYVTSVGGAEYSGSAAHPVGLRVWDTPGAYGGGGGTSSRVPAPPWQPHGAHRELPDASAYAVPGGVGNVPVCESAADCAWTPQGGTSLTASVLGAAGTLLAQELGTSSGPARWGNLAGFFWRAGLGPGDVSDITAGANTVFTRTCCLATAGYDTASGWGLFNPDGLDLALARERSSPRGTKTGATTAAS